MFNLKIGYFSIRNCLNYLQHLTAQNIKSRCTDKIDLIVLFTTTTKCKLRAYKHNRSSVRKENETFVALL